jgi:nitrate/nitrite transporter NarK
MKMTAEMVVEALLATLALIVLRLLGVIDWTWWAILIPIWLPATVLAFIVFVIVVHDVMSTPEERMKARERRHHRHFGL